MKRLAYALFLVVIGAMPAAAEWEISGYTGFQTAPHSDVKGDANGSSFDFNAEWEGKPFEAPPYYGFRATWWQSKNLGYALDFNHAKVYADGDTRRDNGFDRLEFTDGLNIITMNVFYRWPKENRRFTPYVGAGLGVAIPHVDVEIGASRTFEYQLTGPAVQLVAGASYDLNERWAVFGEYKGTYSQNEADLEGGGSLETDIITNALNVGLTFKF